MTTETATNDVLTLHRGVQSRWQGERSIGADIGTRHTSSGITDSLIDRLPGLASLDGRFGTDAFDIASAISLDAGILASGGLHLRAMSLAELADIVQIILEEEESLDFDFDFESASPRVARKVRKVRKVAPKQPGQAAKVAAVKRAVAAARKQAVQRQQARRATAMKAAQARVAQLRAQFADATEIAAAQSRVETLQQAATDSPLSAATGDFLSAEPDDMGPGVPGTLGIRALAHSLRADAPLSRSFTGVSAADLDVIGDLHPGATVGGVQWHHTATRALRMADATAELAMLAPGVEGPDFFSAAAQPTYATSAPFDAVREQPAAAPPAGETPAPLQAAARLATLRAASRQPATRRPDLARAAVAQPTRLHHSPAVLHRAPAAHAPAAVGAPIASAPGSTHPHPIAALTAASRFTATQLQARARSLRAMAPSLAPSTATQRTGSAWKQEVSPL